APAVASVYFVNVVDKVDYTKATKDRRAKADAVVVNTGGITARLSDGTKFGDATPGNWLSKPFYGELGTFFADVNGDGMADAIVVNHDGIAVRLSTGSGFGESKEWSGPFYGALGT